MPRTRPSRLRRESLRPEPGDHRAAASKVSRARTENLGAEFRDIFVASNFCASGHTFGRGGRECRDKMEITINGDMLRRIGID